MDPVDPSALLQGRTRETTIFRDAEGRWFQDGEPLEHPNLTRAFDRWVGRADDGRYCLKNDINWAYITLEGAPYFVRGVRASESGAQEPMLALSNDAVVPLPLETLRLGPEGALYCDVDAPDGTGPMVARFERHAATQLERWLGEDSGGVFVEVAGKRVRPKTVSNPLQSSSETA
jgi:hypothetical protein